MKNLENFDVQELSLLEAKQINGGYTYYWADIINHARIVGGAAVEGGKWVLGLFAGMADGISDGLKD